MNQEEPKRAEVVPEPWGLGLGPPEQGSREGVSSVRLENQFLRARVLVEHGGMLAELEDLVAASGVLASPSSPPSELGGGVRFHCGSGTDAILGGSVEYQVLEADDDQDPAVLVLHTLVPGEPVSFQGAFAVHPESPALSMEFSVQNRSLQPLFTPCGLRFNLEGAEVSGVWEEGLVVIALPSGHALVLQSPPHTWDELRFEGSELVLLRHAEPLAPLGKGSWSCTLWPLAHVGKLWAVGQDSVVSLREDQTLVARVRTPLPRAKVVLGLASGETVEAAADLTPSSPFLADLTPQGLTPVQAVVLDSSKRVLAQGGPERTLIKPIAREPRRLPDALDEYQQGLDRFLRGESPHELWRTSRCAFFSAASFALLAVDASSQGGHESAIERIEEALHRAGDHAIYWWLKAALTRACGEDPDDAVPYAHSLSPMEPLLRMEGFLCQDPFSPVGSDLLRPLVDKPEAAHDVVAMLFTLGLRQDAARVADELLRHKEMPLVRMMLAWSLLRTTRHEAEAAQHLVVVESQPVVPPYPHRPYEIESVLGLAEWAASSARLREWATLAGG